jgi:hypothetical protein
MSLPVRAHSRTLQAEVCGLARRTRSIAILVYVPTDVVVVVKRLDQTSVSFGRRLARGFE